MMGWCKHCAQNRQMERDPINGFFCGRVIDQDVFSTEVTFVKGAGGQSQMSGNYVRTVQGEHYESHERTLNKGRDEISDMVVSLGVGGGNSIIDPAFAFYKRLRGILLGGGEHHRLQLLALTLLAGKVLYV
ncbi:uncharacterized protein LOC122087616 isoform X3 [Macadamia integrifolia]|uniref:uncharacterized protein LOC122087616 isoform X3 n=1 Tax=Macadamia integrifolia TaxID=60698 RepID=UPI001C4ED9C5|nr:uncharacterized protein LOC122087616 isoform X3 [Macadamia integrifolia]